MQIGIDIVSIKRIQHILQKHSQKFLERFLSPQEILLTKQNPQSIAGFWAAKEACSKALGTGIGAELAFLDIYISKDSRNMPLLTLSSDKMTHFNLIGLSLSISHEKEFAIAVVLAR